MLELERHRDLGPEREAHHVRAAEPLARNQRAEVAVNLLDPDRTRPIVRTPVTAQVGKHQPVPITQLVGDP